MHPAAAIATLIFGLLFLVMLVAGFIEARRSTKWPVVEGVITESTTELRKGGKTHTYHPKIEYRFSVAGETFTGNRIAGSSTGWSLKELAEKAAQKFPEGSFCKVFYNPKNPRSCLLQPGLKPAELLLLLIPAVLIAVGWHFLAK